HSPRSSCRRVLLLPPPRPALFPYTTLFRSPEQVRVRQRIAREMAVLDHRDDAALEAAECAPALGLELVAGGSGGLRHGAAQLEQDRKSTRLNSSHQIISYAVFCLKKKNENE